MATGRVVVNGLHFEVGLPPSLGVQTAEGLAIDFTVRPSGLREGDMITYTLSGGKAATPVKITSPSSVIVRCTDSAGRRKWEGWAVIIVDSNTHGYMSARLSPAVGDVLHESNGPGVWTIARVDAAIFDGDPLLHVAL